MWLCMFRQKSSFQYEDKIISVQTHVPGLEIVSVYLLTQGFAPC